MLSQPSHTTTARLQEASSLLLVTALCGAGGALTATQAEAAVVSTPGISPSTPLLVPDTLDGVYINVVTGGTGVTAATAPAGWDLNPYSVTAGQLSWWGATTTTWLAVSGSPGTGAIAVPTGTIVDATGTYVRPGSSGSATAGASPGEFTFNAMNYVGFQFPNEATGQTHFGYMAILVGSSFADRSIYGLFYEDTAGAAINVAAVPVPEPTGALLAAGAAGLLTLRRRRQAA